jgi:hypothetical protein
VKSSISFPAGLAADAGADAGDEAGAEAGADVGDLVVAAELVVVVVEVVEVVPGEQARLLSSKVVKAAVNIIFFIGGLLCVIYKAGNYLRAAGCPTVNGCLARKVQSWKDDFGGAPQLK